ncbi:MAG: GNAT family N-acetyltransferase [Candidatus Puniceispirillaceae bacterium]
MTKVPINIRSALKGDAKMMQAIASAAYQPYIKEIGRKPTPMIADFDTHIAKDVCLVLWLAGKIAGYAVILHRADGYWLENIAVHPEHHKKGLGTALIEAVEAIIRPRADHYQLYTNIVMQSNARWYLSLGFKQTKEAMEDGFHRLYFKKTLSQ